MYSTVFSEINWLALLVAAIAYFALGAVWYGALFSKKWVAYQGIDMNDPNVKKGTGAIMVFSFVLMFFVTFALAVLINRIAPTGGALSGFKIGLFTGLCFAATAISITYLYIKKPVGLHVIDGLYHVTGQIIAAIILCVWK